jgi:hypothetical protein
MGKDEIVLVIRSLEFISESVVNDTPLEFKERVEIAKNILDLKIRLKKELENENCKTN